MSQYFDKDFFKLLLGFMAIVSVSLIIIIATKLYEERSVEKSEKSKSPVISIKVNNEKL